MNYFMILIGVLQLAASGFYVLSGNNPMAILVALYGLTNFVLFYIGEVT